MSKYPKITNKDLILSLPSKGVLEMINKVYGRLKVKSFAGKRVVGKSQSFYINCECSCGKEVLANCGHVKGGKLSSCGCISIEKPNRFIHGYAPLKGKREKIYHAWKGMHTRVNPNNNDTTRKYQEKGIKVCEGWSGKNGFLKFKEQMFPPTDKSLDRINNDLHYSCGKCNECVKEGWELNCRWSNDEIQSNNRSDFNNWIIIDGKKMTYRQASRHLGFPEKTLQSRVKNLGWSIDRAINTPITNNKTRHLYK